jgi:hypothetical protein
MPLDRQPGDLLLDRFVPSASPEDRARARTAFLAYGKHLLALAQSLADHAGDIPAGAPEADATMEDTPDTSP